MGDARPCGRPYGAPVSPSLDEPLAAGRVVLDRSELLARENAAETLSRGRLYAVLVLGAAAAGVAATWLHTSPSGHVWLIFAALAAGATVAQAFPVQSRNMLYHTSVVFLVAAALLLPPQLLVLVAIAQILPDWARERRPWALLGFDAANYTLNALAAWGAAHLVQAHGTGLVTDAHLRFALAGLAACIAFVASNHLLVAAVLRPDCDRFRGASLASLESVSVDFVLTVLGISLAAFAETNPWLVFAALAPLVVVHRSLSVPRLQAEARVDAKTGLYNARWFASSLAAELGRAARFERPMAVIMADLDLLREINNTYGHLAGDAVLRGVADIFRRELRDYDVPARFGGEEFSILLPETTADQALEIAERIRRAIAARPFAVSTASEPVHATVSIGVAAFPQHGLDAEEIVHRADVAVYRAKLQGRNRVLAAGGEPQLFATGPSRPAAGRPASLRVTAASGEAPTGSEWGEGSVPPAPEPARERWRTPSRLLRDTQAALAGDSQRALQRLRRTAEAIEARNASLEEDNRLLRERANAALESLSVTVDARDPYAAGHARRVQELAVAIGAELDLSQAELDVVNRAALLHDVGKLVVPEALLVKPDRLTPIERRLMESHAEEGARMVEQLGFLDDAVPAIRHHHEHWNGSGYPDGLVADEIPLGARIIHVAEALDTMLTARSYREPQTLDDALREIAAAAGGQFCPRCVAALERLLPLEAPIGDVSALVAV